MTCSWFCLWFLAVACTPSIFLLNTEMPLKVFALTLLIPPHWPLSELTTVTKYHKMEHKILFPLEWTLENKEKKICLNSFILRIWRIVACSNYLIFIEWKVVQEGINHDILNSTIKKPLRMKISNVILSDEKFMLNNIQNSDFFFQKKVWALYILRGPWKKLTVPRMGGGR